MHIGIAGAQSVGKTTLLNVLRSEKRFAHYAICDEVTRQVKELGLPINEDGGDATQRLIMQQHVINIFMYDSMITDRTALDGIVYTTWLKARGSISDDTLTYARQIYERCMPKYDFLFYIPPEFDIKDDGVRSTSTSFRNEIVGLFDGFLEELPVEYTTLTGSVIERAQKVIDTVKP